MYRKLSLLLLVVVLASLPLVAHGGRVAYKGTFSQGSLISDGTFTGIGNANLAVTLNASGIPVVTCSNQGGNEAPGQNPSRVSSSGEGNVGGGNIQKNGKAPLSMTAPNPTITWEEGGCPSANWTANVVGVLWDVATITALDGANVAFTQTYCLQSSSIAPGTPVEVVACQ